MTDPLRKAWEDWLDAPSGDEATNHALAEAIAAGPTFNQHTPDPDGTTAAVLLQQHTNQAPGDLT